VAGGAVAVTGGAFFGAHAVAPTNDAMQNQTRKCLEPIGPIEPKILD